MAKKKKVRKKSTSTIKSMFNKNKSRLINLRVSQKEEAAIQKKADKFANGNYSAWLRYAGANYTPSKEEIINVEES